MAILELHPTEIDKYLEQVYPELNSLVKELDNRNSNFKVSAVPLYQATMQDQTPIICNFIVNTFTVPQIQSPTVQETTTQQVHASFVPSSAPNRNSNLRVRQYEDFKNTVLLSLKRIEKPMKTIQKYTRKPTKYENMLHEFLHK